MAARVAACVVILITLTVCAAVALAVWPFCRAAMAIYHHGRRTPENGKGKGIKAGKDDIRL